MGVYDALLTNPYIQLNSGADGDNNIYFTDTSGSYGFIKYNHTSDILNSYMLFAVNTLPRMYLYQTNVNFTDLDIITTGDVDCGSLTCVPTVDKSYPETTFGIYAGSLNTQRDLDIELCSSGASSFGSLSFTNTVGGKEGRIAYDHSAQSMSFRCNDLVQLTINETTDTADFNDNAITKTGNITTTSGNISGNLNSTRGQLCTFMGEQNSTLVVGDFTFYYGNGSQSTARWGMLIPFECKVKRFTYASSPGTGSAFTTATVIVFRCHSDNVAMNLYAICDFNTVRSDITNRRYVQVYLVQIQ
jgi:hypothetical protein